MRHVAIEINILEMLEDQTTHNEKFDPDDWSLEDVAILRRIANFIEREQNDKRQSEQSVENIQHKTH